MNYLHRAEHWGETHHPRYMDIVRIALGVFLIYKGVDFLRNMGLMQDLMATSLTSGSFAVMLIGHYVVFAHITGGIFLAMGVLTRAACLIQIPILIGAVLFVNTSHEVFRPYSELIVSIIVLLLLIYFLMAGNGTWVVDMSEKEEKRIR